MLLFNDYFRGSGVTINAMHPGAVKTGAGENNDPLYGVQGYHEGPALPVSRPAAVVVQVPADGGKNNRC